MMKKLLTLLALTFSFALLQSAQAAGIVLTPPKFEFDADPGQTINSVVKITNQNSSSLVLTSEAKDFIASGETGTPTFVDPGEGNEAISLASWININDQQPVVVRPGQKVEIPFTITVPENAEPGGKYGTMFFAPPAGEGQLSVVQKIGSLILVRVSGEIVEEGQLDTFGAYPANLPGEEIPNTSSDFFFEKPPVDFAVRYENTGNVQVKPQGKIEIFNTFGGQVTPAGVLTIINEGGVELRKEIVDYVPVNDGRGNVLAKSFRTFNASWNGIPYWYKEEDGTKVIKYKGYPIGLYTAELSLTGAKGETITESIKFFVFPAKEILGGLLAAVVAIFALIKYRAWSRRRLEEQIRKQMAK